MYLIKEKPNLTIKLLVIFLISTILIRTFGMLLELEIGQYLILYPRNLSQPLSWYRFLTYPLDSLGLKSWFSIASVILPAGFLIEKRTTKKSLITIILISVLIEGLLFTIINQGDELNRPIASAGLMAWGFWIAAIACGIIQRKKLKLIEKSILIIFLISILTFSHSDIGYFVAQIGVVLAVLIYVLTFKVFQSKTVVNNTILAANSYSVAS